MEKEVMYYKRLPNQKVQCELCPHYCVILPDDRGLCRGRKNIDGKLYAINYGKTVSLNSDPVEKKPLYHFLPGSNVISLGPNSCNFSCDFCQNYTISQFDAPTYEITPQDIVSLCRNNSVELVAFTYTEPITWYEFVLEASRLLKSQNIKTIMVSNGFINQEPLKELLKVIDAVNVDFKSIDENFYQSLCKGHVNPVLESIQTFNEHCHVEITNLLIPGKNDSDHHIRELAKMIASINREIPLHFSKYFPHYKMTTNPTPDATLYHAKEIASEYIDYIYLGNILTTNDTHCPNCDKLLIKRNYRAATTIHENKCPNCGHYIYGVFA